MYQDVSSIDRSTAEKMNELVVNSLRNGNFTD